MLHIIDHLLNVYFFFANYVFKVYDDLLGGSKKVSECIPCVCLINIRILMSCMIMYIQKRNNVYEI